MTKDVDALTRELLEKLRSRAVELGTELVRISDTITVLERQLNLPPTEHAMTPSFSASVSVRQETTDEAKVPTTSAQTRVFKKNAFFGLTQKEAAIRLLRAVGEPMALNDMIKTLQATGYPFKAQSPYRVLYSILAEAPEIYKHGARYALKEWRTNPPSPNGMPLVEDEPEKKDEANE